ncbi:DEAD/DEAH box helicase [Streptomyces virens]|uniref:DEAD/DEAH box helicase n=1 Tax=Streptomyces virens TaxID=285572 RepID=A0ABP6P6T1_9ACTN|nr:DEAD/DEAH box helicase [Streptomyces calvus]MBA8978662.1 ATP-dependent Lhr-like helicase [Streptomyces calvus]MYS26044.1 DEAD/DEAH box helicase [Streptomyces sp. SID7804]
MSEGAATGTDPIDRLDPVVLHHIVNSLGWPGLRPLQSAAIGPLLDGEDAVLLAPTAGGKTEAAAFPLLTAMARNGWSGTSVLYLTPLRALLNNLQPRLHTYAQWLGRTAALWHGDTAEAERRRLRREPPDILLTTPESLEAQLISVKTDHALLLGAVQTVVVDEVHAFAGDDRGWHLLAVLERLQRLTGRSLQRIGLSATVGNPDQLLAWLQGSGHGHRPGRVVAPGVGLRPLPASGEARRESGGPPPGDIELDYVGSLPNAATVISALHRGEKRLVFCESRRQVEELGQALRARGVTVFLSHSSLSAAERHRSEEAFAQARDCVIVATSTLELGIDVGDLDRVIQIDSPATVASFLQRLGRTGRRPDSTRNCLFLTTSHESLLQAAGLLLLWGRHWVEPVTAPPGPQHLVAQQLLAVTLQRHKLPAADWQDEWNGLAPFDATARPVLDHLLTEGFLEQDSGIYFIGEQAEKRFGRRHFMDLTASFTAPPQFTVLHGRSEIGHTDPALLVEEHEGPLRLLLAGRSWQVTYVDWRRQRVFVEAAESGGVAKWQSGSIRGLSYELAQALREVLLGADPEVRLTRRAQAAVAELRETEGRFTHPEMTLITRHGRDVRWWTWAGFRANATLAAWLANAVDPLQRPADAYVRLRHDLTHEEWAQARRQPCKEHLPQVSTVAIRGLKFSAALPEDLATRVLASRIADPDGALAVLSQPARWETETV